MIIKYSGIELFPGQEDIDDRCRHHTGREDQES